MEDEAKAGPEHGGEAAPRPAVRVWPRKKVMSGPGVRISSRDAAVKAARISGAGRKVMAESCSELHVAVGRTRQ